MTRLTKPVWRTTREAYTFLRAGESRKRPVAIGLLPRDLVAIRGKHGRITKAQTIKWLVEQLVRYGFDLDKPRPGPAELDDSTPSTRSTRSTKLQLLTD